MMRKSGLQQGATRKLAEHASALTYEMLPQELVDLTKRCILDTLGVTLGASCLSPKGKDLADYVYEQGGKAESTVLGFGFRAPAGAAVFVNGSLGHMLDYDDVGKTGHLSIVTIPVAFALAERKGGIGGKDFIAAVAAGMDVMTRLGAAITIPQWISNEGWFATQLLGYIAGSATAGHVLGLDADQMENAFGNAFTQTAGSRQMAVDELTDLRAMQAGFCGQGAVLAADLAQRGIIGSKAVIEGKYGFFKTYVRDEAPDWQALTGELGTRFPVLNSHGFKVWPHCAHIRPCTAAILQLRRDGVDPEAVQQVDIVGGSQATQLLSTPIDSKRRPQAAIDAKYSVPFTSAVAITKGNVTLRDYTPEGLSDPVVLAMADRIQYRPDPTSNSLMPTVEMRLKNGDMRACQVQSVPGDANEPVGWAEIEAKFRDCMSFVAVEPSNVDFMVERIANLEKMADATALLNVLN